MKTLLSLLVAALAAQPAPASTFIVTTNADAGPGSLRQAILDANGAAGDDAIAFAPALKGQIIRLTSGQLAVSGNVSILGPGPDQLAIEGNGTNRVFYLSPGRTNLIAGLTITNGHGDRVGDTFAGGGIYNDCAALTVSNVVLSGNSSDGYGGGIYNCGFSGGAPLPLTLQNCTFNGNSAVFGGGICNLALRGSATLTLHNCTLSGNSASYDGGGIYNWGAGGSATLTVQNCTLSGNSATYYGGGIHNRSAGGSAALTLQYCTLDGNSAGFDGGGIYNTDATLALQNTTLDSNSASSNGDGIFNYGATLTLQNSTFSGNSAGRGGGIHNFGPGGSSALELENCTLSGNSARDEGGGIFNWGGGGRSASLTLQHCTLNRNSAPDGGGILNYGAMLMITHTLLGKGVSGENYSALFNASVANLGYNLSDDDSTGNFATTVPNLFLGPLTNNGGPTFTHALLSGSPAINAGSPAFTPPPDFDQRGPGFPRVVVGTVDIGALESPFISTDTLLASVPNPSMVGQTVTFTATVTTQGPGAGTPTGTLEFFDGTDRLGAGILDSRGQASLALSFMTAGNHSITASYLGDTHSFPSVSAAVSQTVLSLTDPAVWFAGSVEHTNTRFLQTLLMQQLQTLTNVTSQTLAAVRITIHLSAAEQAKHIYVHNASGTNDAGEPYLQHNFPIPPGGQVTFTAEYDSPDRVTVPNPAFTVELVPPQVLVAPPGTAQPVLRERVRVLAPDNAFLIDFTTAAGARYFILYSSDMANWSVAQPSVAGTGDVVPWVDCGPPKTRSHPGTEAQRFYQVLKAD